MKTFCVFKHVLNNIKVLKQAELDQQYEEQK